MVVVVVIAVRVKVVVVVVATAVALVVVAVMMVAISAATLGATFRKLFHFVGGRSCNQECNEIAGILSST